MTVSDDKDIEEGPLLGPDASEGKPVSAVDSRRILGLPVHIVSGSAYCVASASMVLLNKAALSSFDFNSKTSLLFFQCLVCVILVKLADLFGFVSLEPWNMRIIQVSRTSIFFLLNSVLKALVHNICVTLAGMVPGQLDICRHDMDQFLCTQGPWRSHVHCTKEPDKLVRHWRGLLLLWQDVWQICVVDSCTDDDLSCLWCCH